MVTRDGSWRLSWLLLLSIGCIVGIFLSGLLLLRVDNSIVSDPRQLDLPTRDAYVLRTGCSALIQSLRGHGDDKDGVFHWHDGVVIATKIQGREKDVVQLKQSLCLLTEAYNRHLHYDIIVFATLPIPEAQVTEFQQVVHQSKLTVVRNHPKTIAEVVHDMPADQRAYLPTM